MSRIWLRRDFRMSPPLASWRGAPRSFQRQPNARRGMDCPPVLLGAALHGRCPQRLTHSGWKTQPAMGRALPPGFPAEAGGDPAGSQCVNPCPGEGRSRAALALSACSKVSKGSRFSKTEPQLLLLLPWGRLEEGVSKYPLKMPGV